jgi:hypothetical protein
MASPLAWAINWAKRAIPCSDALEGPFLHRLFSLADLGGQKDPGAYSGDGASICSTAAIAIGALLSHPLLSRFRIGGCLTGLQNGTTNDGRLR